MPATPPVLPAHALQRVRAIARVDGWSIVIIAGVSGLVTLIQGHAMETVAALLVTLTGAAELHGRNRLTARDPRGLGWMIGAQVALLVIIWGYAWYRWHYFDAAALWAELPGFVRATLDQQLLTAGLVPEFDRPWFLELVNRLTCLVLAVVSFVYQGGLAVFYASRRDQIRQAVEQS